MKNKEIEELLNDIKTHDYKVLNREDYSLLLSYIEQLEKKVDQYENPDDLTLFYMWLDEKAKDKMKQLENNRDKAIEYVESHFIFNDKTGECYQTYTFDKDNVKKLYDILKGDSDNE